MYWRFYSTFVQLNAVVVFEGLHDEGEHEVDHNVGTQQHERVALPQEAVN
jgi:hypothetical protein